MSPALSTLEVGMSPIQLKEKEGEGEGETEVKSGSESHLRHSTVSRRLAFLRTLPLLPFEDPSTNPKCNFRRLTKKVMRQIAYPSLVQLLLLFLR
jgi:hypothetical protein